MPIDSAATLRADWISMNEFSSSISSVFQHWWQGVLIASALLMVTSCSLPAGNGGLSVATPNVQGVYQGSYTYGGAYQKLAGQTVTFEISVQQAHGSSKIKGVIKETYTGFGTLKDGFVWADFRGSCESENGFIHLQFTKTYRHFKHPPVAYRGSLPPGSTLLAGTWYFPSKPSESGMFQISNIHVQ